MRVAIERWRPRVEISKKEEFILRRVEKKRRLFCFLRMHRHEIFDEAFQAELEGMYRDSGAGKQPLPPAFMAMVLILQGYVGASDSDAVELSVLDARWQMILDIIGDVEPAFSQGALHDFRERMIRHDMDRRLLERTVLLARAAGFDSKMVPRTLRIAMDSSPLEGAGRVEDTINLLAHAARNLVTCAAALMNCEREEICRRAKAPLFLESSVKKGLDRNWSDPRERDEAVNDLAEQILALERWIERELPDAVKQPPLKTHFDTLHQIVEQDLEPDPNGGGGGVKIRRGVAEERRISINDREMRHGRKTKTKAFNGFKRHIATDIDTKLVVACAVTPANRPEDEAAAHLHRDIKRLGAEVRELFIDRGYIKSPVVEQILANGGDIVCRPWMIRNLRNSALFTKDDFAIDLRARTVTCPAGVVEKLRVPGAIEFPAARCDRCRLRDECTDAQPGTGRTITMAPDEPLQIRLRKRAKTPRGREQLRKRVAVEHALAHVGRRQGRRARYLGVRKNVFDLRRAAAISNLELIQRSAA